MRIPQSVKVYFNKISKLEQTVYKKEIIMLLKCFHFNNYIPMTIGEMTKYIGKNPVTNILLWNEIVLVCKTISSCNETECTIVKNLKHRVCCKQLQNIMFGLVDFVKIMLQ